MALTSPRNSETTSQHLYPSTPSIYTVTCGDIYIQQWQTQYHSTRPLKSTHGMLHSTKQRSRILKGCRSR